MQGLIAPLALVRARARRRPGRWLLPALGIALATAFAVAIAAESVIAGDQSARAVLAAVSPADRAVRVTWEGPLTPAAEPQARRLLRRLGLEAQTEVVLLGQVRLGDAVVRPGAIAPLPRWVAGVTARRLGPCRPTGCPMILVGGGSVASILAATGVRIEVVGSAPLVSPVPLGFAPSSDGHQPVLLTSDVVGLDALAGLSGVFRTHGWLAPLPVTRWHSWQLAAAEARMARSQAALLASGSQFSLSAPFSELDDARAQASAAPRRLLLTGGGALATLALFIVLAGGQLRRDQQAELERLRYAGARTSQCALYVAAESCWLCAVGLGAGAGLGTAAAAMLAHFSGEPMTGILGHSLATGRGALALTGGWLAATSLVTTAALARSVRVVDVVAIAAGCALGFGLLVSSGGDHTLDALLAPMCCLAAGLLTYRGAAAGLAACERLARGEPVRVRLALVGLARAPALPALAIAFLAVSLGLGGFALAYQATLVRGADDQAADRVPLDALVSSGQAFVTPLQLAPLDRWRRVAPGTVLPVRRTEANYLSRDGTITIPALGVPAEGLALMHGWRTSDGSAPIAQLGRRLRPPGRARVPGPGLPPGAGWLSVYARSPALAVSVTADLRDPQGAIQQVPLGTAGARGGFLRARVPAGRWEVEAFELDEPTGLAATNGHQNAENPAAATHFEASLILGPLLARPGGAPASPGASGGHPPLRVGLGDWRAVGAATRPRPPTAGAAAEVGFATSGLPGLLRPEQPSDTRPVPVLADPHTAAAAGPGGRLALTVAGQPVSARVVGTVCRFPTLAADAAGVVIADEPTLASALDAQLPGQGRSDELWIASEDLRSLRAALNHGSLAQLSSSYRADLVRKLQDAPLARAMLGTLIAAAGLSAALAVLGLLSALLGGGRDERVERDLEAQGIGPRALRSEARMRLMLAGGLGVGAGVVIAILLTRLAVVSVGAADTAGAPRPSVVAVVPSLELAAWAIGAFAVLAVASRLATRAVISGGVMSQAVR